MPLGQPPLQSSLPVDAKASQAAWTKPWGTWFTQIWQAVFGWKHTFYATKINDFGSINAQAEATTTVTITGARSGDIVIVRPTTAVNGIILDGTVTADNTVTVRAANYSSGAIDPASQTYMVLVFQQ